MMSRRNSRRASARAQRSGFTLVEMMVALTAGAIAITSIYFVSAASSQHFQEQQQIAGMQTALRVGADRLRSDLERAGFLGSVNPSMVQEGNYCKGTLASGTGAPAGVGADGYAAAIWAKNGVYTAVLPNATMNHVEADQLRMTGNYATADEYSAKIVTYAAGGGTIQVSINTQSFRRSFGTSTSEDDYGPAFIEVFRIGRAIRLVTETGRMVLLEISGSSKGTGTGPIITFVETGVTLGCLTIDSNVFVAPLMRIQYSVEADYSAAAATKFAGSAALTSSQNGPFLIRRELSFTGVGLPVADSGQVILEHIANFDVDFIVDNRADSINTPNVVFLDDPTTVADDLTNQLDVSAAPVIGTTGPQRVRSAIFEISVRSPLEDTHFPFKTLATGEKPLRYELATGTPGAARMRTIRSEIFLPNIAYKGRLHD